MSNKYVSNVSTTKACDVVKTNRQCHFHLLFQKTVSEINVQTLTLDFMLDGVKFQQLHFLLVRLKQRFLK